MTSRIAKKLFAAGSALAMAASALPAFAAAHSVGQNVSTPDGTVWMIFQGQAGTCRRAYTSAGAFLSYGFNSWSQVVAANADDTALPTCGEGFIPPQDGSIIFSDRGSDKGTGYVISGGQKYGFPTEAIFKGQGYSYSTAMWADLSWMAMGGVINSADAAHLPGNLVNNGGTVQFVASAGLWGFPGLAEFNSFGYSFAKVVPANTADKAKTQVGVVSLRQPGQLNPGSGMTTTPTPGTGTYSAVVASTNPAAGTLVKNQSTADLAHFTISGTGTVNSLTFKRIGVSADATLTNVYLFEGSTRLTDAASVSSGMITFGGLNWSLNGSKTVSVRSDIANLSDTAGQTVGVQLAKINDADVAGMPSGNVHTIASATLATVAVGTPTSTSSTDPQNDVNLWESTVNVGTREVVLSRIALRQIENIQSADVRNFRLFVDGTQVASSPSLDANGYVTFSGFTRTLNVGNRNFKVLADVIGGSSRNIKMSLRNKADIDVKDMQYNVNVSATGTFPAQPSSATAVNPGNLTVTKATTSISGDVTKDASSVSLGKWNFTAYGEPIKVETLIVGVDTSDTDSEITLRNGRILVNGSQVGSTTGLVASNAFAAGTSFTTNFIVNPGTPATVEVVADIYDENTTGGNNMTANDTIQTSLLAGSSNATRQVSLGTVSVPSGNVNANSVTVKVGALSIGKTSTYGNQTSTSPQTAYKLGSFRVSGNSTEAVNVHTLTLDVTVADNSGGATATVADITDVYLKVNGSQSTVKPTVSATGNSYAMSFAIPVNGDATVEVYGNINSDLIATDTVATALLATGTTANSGTSVNTNSGVTFAGQTVTIASGSIAVAAAAEMPVAAITEDEMTRTVGAFKWTSSNETMTISEVNVDIAGASTVSNVVLKDGSTVLATKPGATDVTFSGLNVTVPANDSNGKVLTVELQLNSVGSGAGTSREDVAVTLDTYKSRDSQGVESSNDVNVVGNSLLVFKAIPTITAASLGGVGVATESKIYENTITATGGSIGVKQLGYKVTISDNGTGQTLTIGGFKFYRDGVDYTSSVTIRDQAGNDVKQGGSTFDEGDTHVYVTFSSGAVEDQISGSRTYALYATPSNFNSTDDDSFRVEMLNDTASANRYLNDADATTAELIATLAASAGTGKAALPQYLLWSDLSATTHLATSPDDADGTADVSTSSADWTNGYLVKNLPTSAATFTF